MYLSFLCFLGGGDLDLLLLLFLRGLLLLLLLEEDLPLLLDLDVLMLFLTEPFSECLSSSALIRFRAGNKAGFGLTFLGEFCLDESLGVPWSDDRPLARFLASI
mmetsp:Transcript_21002/g.34259  ORF Transcript_21002/g.34259 Transcript_21002/m.34259 type:complete len:104 (+) Transcript_21002:641-952(+)